ncbi:hypothetical protein J7K28_04060 [Candidatus Aerophobetes bacterium]|nr:hypothetical protein [Candidatus Aerophobetes bacterium]
MLLNCPIFFIEFIGGVFYPGEQFFPTLNVALIKGDLFSINDLEGFHWSLFR